MKSTANPPTAAGEKLNNSPITKNKPSNKLICNMVNTACFKLTQARPLEIFSLVNVNLKNFQQKITM